MNRGSRGRRTGHVGDNEEALYLLRSSEHLLLQCQELSLEEVPAPPPQLLLLLLHPDYGRLDGGSPTGGGKHTTSSGTLHPFF